ncbi:uncharacterized protein MELLADRAFT_106401 [Melampsora larici-populina 98AG31]|uniref:Uncharacterized protein n=1 Tax=Melampsora larici-populina (strain 98AG31 / pathotype 3-4-7) TaxID=747676 RepID=F4RL97_MELLP|nr:uncharacterized protein MELLADRAFT_106401 [Melampsora larici-populina 98AG31]EGG06908.1 hypothetical protein MELLADRAFT_106401 [Melampsora larici-populina 98AG31]
MGNAQKKDQLEHATQSTPLIQQFLLQEGQGPSAQLDSDQPHSNFNSQVQVDDEAFLNFNHQEDNEPLDEDIEPPAEIDSHDFLRCPEHNKLEPLLEAMAEACYQHAQLQQQNRWASQCDQMLPAFLQGRL